MTDKDDAFLDDMFAAARDIDTSVPEILHDRVLADAALVPRAPVQDTMWQSLVAAIGGWPALGGVMTAGLVGVWVGFMPPLQVETFAANVLGTTTTVSFLGDFDDLIEPELTDG